MIGSNVSTVGGIDKGFIQADKWKCECIQIYTTPSRTWNVPKLTLEKINKFKQAWEKSNVKEVTAHVPFLVNLASADIKLWDRSVQRLITEIENAKQLGIKYLIIHPGSSGKSSKEEGLIRIYKAINKAFDLIQSELPILLLETMAGQGTMLGSNFEEIKIILDKVKNDSRIGVCFDTCHVYAAGYDLRGFQGYKRVFDEFNKIIGIEKIKVFHINDSLTFLDSKVDRHCGLGRGYIGFEFYQSLLKDKRFNTCPKILENPNRDEESFEDLETLRKLKFSKKNVVDPPIEIPQKQLNLF